MKIKIKDLTLFAMLGCITFALKFLMAGLPNIEPVTLLVMIYAYTFKWKALYPVSVYVILEMLVYGFGYWTIGYCYIWYVLVILSILILPQIKNSWGAAGLAGMFGLLFGALYIPVYAIYGGIEYGFTWWIAGIPYDAIHGVANATLAMALYKPLSTVFKNMYERY